MRGEVLADGVFVWGTRGQRLMAKARVGEVKEKGVLLSPWEACWLAEENRLDLVSDGEVIPAWRYALDLETEAPGHLLHYAVYRDLRRRTYDCAVRWREIDLWQPQQGRRDEDPDTLLTLHRGGDDLPSDLLDLLGSTTTSGKRLLAAVVDEDWEVTYYHITPWTDERPVPDLSSLDATVTLIEGVPVLHGEDADEVQDQVRMGQRGLDGYLLSLVEAAVLAQWGVPVHGPDGVLAAEDVADLGRARGEDLGRAIDAGLHAAAAGWVPRTGFRFGTHLRLYAPGGAGHSTYLCHRARDPTWRDVARMVRIANKVRKELVLDLPGGLIQISWLRRPYQ